MHTPRAFQIACMWIRRYYENPIKGDPVAYSPTRQFDGGSTKGMVVHENLGQRA